MKQQYFGDRRDLFKYDLLLDVMQAVPMLSSLTFLPMLTRDDSTGQGMLTRFPPGQRDPALVAFLTKHRSDSRAALLKLREFFGGRSFSYAPYREDELFEPDHRDEYFASVPEASLMDSLIFLDPDVGLEPQSPVQFRRGGPEKYLRYAELAGLYARARNSAFIVYQHLQRNKRLIAGDILWKTSRLIEVLNASSIAYVTDDDVVFLGIGTDEAIHEELVKAFEQHGNKHDLAAGRLPV